MSISFNPFFSSSDLTAEAVCRELDIPVSVEESTQPSAPYQSKFLGRLTPLNAAEKKVQEYFVQKVKSNIVEQFGFFYKIKDQSGKTRGYLFGSVHDMTFIGPHLKLHDKIYRSFDKSDSIAFEYDPYESTFLENNSLFDTNFDALMSGAKKSQKMDLEFSLLAHQARKSIFNLESLALHIIPSKVERQKKADPSLLHAALCESSEEKLMKFLEDDTPNDKKKLNDRNENMAQNILKILNLGPGLKVFVCVGAAHMVGEKGIPHLLSLQNYEIKQMKPIENKIFESSLKKDFFRLSTHSLMSIAHSISHTEHGAYAPIHREMALHDIVQTLLKIGSKDGCRSAFIIAENMVVLNM